MVYGDPDPIIVKQDDNGALNIEVNSRPGVDPIYDDHLFQKKTPIASFNNGAKRFGDHKKNKSTCNDDILFVSPISHNRNQNNITKDSNPGDETKEFANMVIENTKKP